MKTEAGRNRTDTSLEGACVLSIKLDLRRHCVLTDIKRRYEQVLARTLRAGGQNPAQDDPLEYSKAALDHGDLVRLRGEIPELNAGSASTVRLERVGQQEVRLMLDDQEVFRQALHPGS